LYQEQDDIRHQYLKRQTFYQFKKSQFMKELTSELSIDKIQSYMGNPIDAEELTKYISVRRKQPSDLEINNNKLVIVLSGFNGDQVTPRRALTENTHDSIIDVGPTFFVVNYNEQRDKIINAVSPENIHLDSSFIGIYNTSYFIQQAVCHMASKDNVPGTDHNSIARD